MVKTDQESSNIELFKAVAKGRGAAGIILETAARSDYEGNGKSEQAVQSIEAFLPWLLEHACDSLNKYNARMGEPNSVGVS